ncbi:ABC transporter permease [Butyrivibrio sp. INlla16]|uniref:ABC transporter permease n=1 Tax=Butyrivibrio sp. INlla16 TaxID=1520807 RepID=UPI000889942E|nr:ABC transporter permease [Butyrivibrio sp. INlla16]SDB65757.1 ABC-2 family transporter protein [Butyrivibrio sp. INlla16]
MRNSLIIIKKQLKDTLRNKTVLIQFILFPVMTLIMENAIRIDGMPEFFFTKLFSVMYIGMAPLTSVASIISEEKEKNTLRVLTMANVRPWQYLLGVGLYVWSICMLGAGVMATGLPRGDVPFYLSVMAIGFAISVLAGACIGIYSRNQMTATSLVMPVMLIFAFCPMLAMFNSSIEKVARFLYTQQLRSIMDNMTFRGMRTADIFILFINAMVMVFLFFITFRKKGLE